MKRKLLFVASRLPWPTTSGRKVSLYHYCRGLAERGFAVSLFVFPEWDQPRELAGKPDFIDEVRFAAPIGRAEKLKNLLCRSFVGKKRWPMQCALYYSRRNAKSIADFAAELNTEAVIFDMIRTAPYMAAIPPGTVRKILDLDDLLSVRYARQLEAGAGDVSVAGRYAGGMSPLADRLLCRGTIGRAVLRAEKKRLEGAELGFSKESDGVILVSPGEAALLNEKLGEEKATAIPMGVDTAAFAPARAVPKRPLTIGFLGNLHVAANVASLDRIIRNILPRLRGNYVFEVVGPCPDEIWERYAEQPRVMFHGEVPALPPVMGGWQLMLCPIAFGSGIKTKILEAMAMGLPVVTNTVGAEGIGAENGRTLFVTDSDEETAALTDCLLADPALCAEVGEAAAAFVQSHFAWEEIFKEFAKPGL